MKKQVIQQINMVSPLHKKQKIFSLFSVYLGEAIDLKKIQEKIKKYPYLSREAILILKLAVNKYVVLTKFGVATFWNVPQRIKEEFIKEISPFVVNFDSKNLYFDTLKVMTGKELEYVKFGKVYLIDCDKEKIQVISLVISQSVALERYEKEIEKRVAELEKLISILRLGRLKGITEKDILREIADILVVRQSTISNLSLFDKPETTWERIELEKLYNKLFYEFDLSDRLDILNEKIKFLADHNRFLLNLISTQREYLLEIIVIVLIFIEIVIFIGEIILK